MDKQIRELAVDILEEFTNCYSEADEDCLVKMIKKLIPENAVVLTREEYEKLFKDGFGIMTSPIGDLRINPEGMRKAVDEIDRLIRVQNELQVINAKYYNEAKDLRRNMAKLRRETYSKEEVDYKIEKERKETAEKFAERLKDTTLYWTDWGRDEDFARQVDEICKEITEGGGQ